MYHAMLANGQDWSHSKGGGGEYWGFYVIQDWRDFIFVMREFKILFSVSMVTCDRSVFHVIREVSNLFFVKCDETT